METSNPYRPEPRFAETLEFTLADILTTEEQAARDTANLDAVAQWLKESN